MENIDRELDGILNKFLKMKLPPSLNFYGDFTVRMKPSTFFFCFYQTLIQHAEDHFYPTIPEFIYTITGREETCTGAVKLNTISNMVQRRFSSFSYTNKLYMENLATEFLRRSSDGLSGKCDTVAIALYLTGRDDVAGDYAHENVLFCSFLEKKIVLYLYEPHGYEEKMYGHYKSVNLFIRYFAQALKKLTGRVVEVVPKSAISMCQGLQAYADPGEGYCVMISYFWLYCVLVLMDKFQLDFIHDLERKILSRKVDFKKLITNFAGYVSLKSIEILQGLPEYKIFIKNFSACIEEEKERTKRVKSHWDKRGKRGEILEGSKDDAPKVRDGEKCGSDDDCLSALCVGGRCVSGEEKMDLE